MTIRKAELSDCPAMASTAAAAFKDEEAFGDLMHPHRHAYPSDWAFSFERRFRAAVFNSSKECFVAIDDYCGAIVGVAEWERWGEGGKKRPTPIGMRMLLTLFTIRFAGRGLSRRKVFKALILGF